MTHETLKEYAGHDEGDSLYEHCSEKVRTSVLGLAVALTFGFSAVELFGGILANSLALVGDAGHMITDSMSLFFALLANWFSTKGADENHSFGHARIEVLAAFVNALLMLGVVLWIFFEAYERVAHPPVVAGAAVMLVAFVGLVVNLVVAWSLSRDKKNLNTRAAFVHVLGDLLGSLAAILAGALVYFGGPAYAIADPILSVFVGLLVLKATYGILKEAVPVLLDAVPEGVNFRSVGDALSALPGVKEVHDLHVWTMAPGHAAVSAHLHTALHCDWDELLMQARRLLSERFGIDHVTLQPERERSRGRSVRSGQPRAGDGEQGAAAGSSLVE